MYGSVRALLDADSNGGTDLELVAAPGANKKIVIDNLVISASANASAFLESGTSTVIFPTVYIAANDPFVLQDVKIVCAANEALTFTATITGNISVWVEYHIEGSY